MNDELREILKELHTANQQIIETATHLLAIVREHETRIARLEQKNG